ncbi:MAG: class II aldolase/adducin family protein [Candidatus Helarchaeota archaeon]
MLPYEDERRHVLEIARKMLHSGHVQGTSGNVSMRIKPKSEDEVEYYVITPSNMDYDEIDVEDIVIINEKGKRVKEAKGKRNSPSVERNLHIGIYKMRPDVGAIIHTHSLFPVTISLLADQLPNEELPPILEDQAVFLGGAIPIAKFGPTGSPELAKCVHEAIGDKQCVILRRHGAVCVGKNLKKAFQNVELLNKTAKVYLTAAPLCKITPLPSEALDRALRLYAATRHL